MAEEILTREGDRELLELAAKAAGHARVDFLSYADDGLVNVYAANGRQSAWNPLTRDGDALRLAVMLNMQVDQQPRMQRAVAMWERRIGQISSISESFDGDQLAATRRAIVRAAAEMGKAK